jgi:hypothetical protein
VSSAKNYVIALLTLTTVAGAGLAWEQYQELIVLRAGALANQDRAEWSKRRAAAAPTKLEEKTAAAPKGVHDDSEAANPADTNWPRGGPGGRNNFGAMLENPDVQRLMSVQRKASLDAKYGALFKSLHLAPEELDRFKNLLVEKGAALMDVLGAARAQGINPRSDPEAFHALVTKAQGEVDASIQSALGEVGFAAYKNFEQTLPQRSVVNQLEQRLSYSSTPLSDAQASQLVQILATTTKPPTESAIRSDIFAMMSGGGTAPQGGGVHVTNATIDQSLGVLAGPQVDALRQIQQEQQAQADLAATLRKLRSGGTGFQPAAPVPNAPPVNPARPSG